MTSAARTAGRTWSGITRPFDENPNLRYLATALVLGFVSIVPFFYDPASGFIDASTTALAYVVMALGLNIVVGFAGLLDLGYVAFYALGALTAGWLGSIFFAKSNESKGLHIFASQAAEQLPG